MKKLIFTVVSLSIIFSTPALGQPLEGMPSSPDPNNIYAADTPNNLSDAVKKMPELVYVPNLKSATVSVIDPKVTK
jgi:hypothetical protein